MQRLSVPAASERLSGVAQPRQNDRDEPAVRRFGWLATGCREGVEAVARKLVRRDIIPDVARRCALGQQVSDEVAAVLRCPGDVLTVMQECRSVASVV